MATLGYCTNVHPGESADELLALVDGPIARVRAGFRPSQPLGAGLWLPLSAARSIATDAAVAEGLRAALEAAGLFAFTVNAFPIGGFHADQVKRAVYAPAWDDPARLDYTLHAARALAALLPEGAAGTISTVPVGYGSFDEAALSRAGAALRSLSAALDQLESESGHSIALALEPEPLAVLETCDQAVGFLEEHVLRDADDEARVRRRVGACVDTCHLACEFEDLTAGVARYERAGVKVVKGQLSSALELRDPADNPEGLARLLAFAEPRYLHQTLGRRPDGALERFEDLPDLLDPEGRLSARAAACEVLRTHFHVPLCWEGDASLGTTRPTLVSGLGALARATEHLEVETYTFGVLPADQRAAFDDDPVNMIVAELRWAEAALSEAGSAS